MSVPNPVQSTLADLGLENFAPGENQEIDPEAPNPPESEENGDEVIIASPESRDLLTNFDDENVEAVEEDDAAGENLETVNIEDFDENEGITNSEQVIIEMLKDFPSEPDLDMSENGENDDVDIEEMEIMDANDSLESTLQMKEMKVVIERCDKIWKTLQIIRNMQPQTSLKRKREVDEEDVELEPEPKSARKVAKKSTTTCAYNADIVTFFSKDLNKLMNRCPKCPKSFCEKRTVRRHALSAHNFFIAHNKRTYVRKKQLPPKKSELNKRKARAQPPPPPVKVTPQKAKQASTGKRTPKPVNTRAKQASQPVEAKNIFEVTTSEDPKTRRVKQKVETAPIFKCLLCSRTSKNIRQHIIGYHKILHPDKVIPSFTEKQRNTRLPVEEAPKEELKKEEPKRQSQKSSLVKATPIDYSAFKSKLPISDAKTKIYRNTINGRFVKTQDIKVQKNQPMVRMRGRAVHPRSASQKSHLVNGKSSGSQKSANQKPASRNLMSQKSGTRKILAKEVAKQKIKAKKSRISRCTICLGLYAYTSISRHMSAHRARGETRENIGSKNVRYKNAILGVKSEDREKENANVTEVQPDPEVFVDEEPEEEEVSSLMASTCTGEPVVSPSESRNSDDSVETICECGRAFRNPHHLYMHKAQCKEPEVGGRTTRSSSDRDSGIGISITIKKKNNSYEVVNNKDNLPDMENTDKGDCNQNSDLGEVLKLQAAEDDVDVDIEDDEDPKGKSAAPTVSTTSDSIVTEDVRRPLKMPELTIHSRLTVEDYEKQVQPNLVKPKLSRARPISQSQTKKKNLDLNGKPRTFQNIRCSCGKVFKGPRAEKFLDIHAINNHPDFFHCAYCKTDFTSFVQCRRHNCAQLGIIDESMVMRPCPLCQEMVDITCAEKFNGHVETCHPNAELPVLCFTCPKRWKDTTLRALHNSKVHLEPPCKICGKRLAYEAMIRHELFHSGYGYPCHTCKFAYMSKSDRQEHQLTQHVGKELKCPMCSKVFKKSCHRILHVKTHHLYSKVCKVCKINVSSLRQLEIHIEQKHQDYPYSTCDACQMQFVDDEEVKKHIKSNECHTPLNSLFDETIDVEEI